MSITTEKILELVEKFRLNEKDTGSVPVQVAILTERVKNLTEHLKIHKHDFDSRRGLLKLVGQRRRLLDYLKRKKINDYRSLILQLNLRR